MNKYMKNQLKEATLRAAENEHQKHLEAISHEIDQIDDSIMEQISRRQELSSELFNYKNNLDLPVLDAAREALRIASLNGAKTIEEKELAAARTSVLRSLFRSGRLRQFRLAQCADSAWDLGKLIETAPRELPNFRQVASPGLPLSFTAETARKYFPEATIQPVATFSAALNRVANAEADAAVLPVENNASGTVVDMFMQLRRNGLYVTASLTRPVKRQLLGLPGSSLGRIRKVVSDRNSLDQNARLIRKMGWRAEETGSAAAAARQVAESGDPTLAAIASEEASRLYNLDTLGQDALGDSAEQMSFIVVTRQPIITEDANRLSIILKLSNQSGALTESMNIFADRNLNISQIHSLPLSPDKPWIQEFFLNIDARRGDEEAVGALYELTHTNIKEVCFLGWYKSDILRSN